MSQPDLLKKVADELDITAKQAEAVSGLLNSGATIPFIARYRKEVTGSLDEVAIQNIRDRLDSLQKLEDRRNAILDSLRERDLLDRELKMKILSAETMTELEDIYLPYRPKKRTRATIAREKGLEGLAEIIYEQEEYDIDTSDYINPGKDVHTSEDAISGAEDIIAEWISEDADIRDRLRKFFNKNAYIESAVVAKKEAEAVKFRDYFDWKERISQVPSHRFLAIIRGQKEGYLTAHIRPDEEKALALIEKLTVKGGDKMTSLYVMDAAHDSYRRLIAPSLETEFINSVKQEADKEAINVFTANLREILMAPPLGQKRVLAIDPGFRTGCKVVALDGQGKLMGNITIYPTTGKKQKEQAGAVVKEMIKNFEIDAIALGNGTASRETESFLRELKLEIPVVVVDESGASIYSASKIAREEFPDHDVTVRGAVSIGRRMQDPLAEIVKIDPKSIGVGQYQHDVDQSLLKQALEDTVVSCVNAVGVEVNTASAQLLTFVAGLGPQLAKNIVKYREENGAFKSRHEIKNVHRLGDKAFEQCAGFLRIHDAKNPLDSSAVHPERYKLVERIASDAGCTVSELMKNESLRRKINLQNYVDDDVGLPTLQDILNELEKPGRDPRAEFEVFSFSQDVQEISDLKPGMILPGIITNVTNFGAFVDIGVHHDGLVHKSQMGKKYVNNPMDVVKVRQKLKVKVLDVDLERQRIALTMRLDEPLDSNAE